MILVTKPSLWTKLNATIILWIVAISISIMQLFLTNKGLKQSKENTSQSTKILGLAEFFDIGLERILTSNTLIDHNIDIINCESLKIIMNDGTRFFTNNSDALEKRNSKNKCTKIFMLNPNLEAVKILNKKNGHTKNVNYYQNKIKETLSGTTFNNELKSSEIYFYDYDFRSSIILTDEYAITGSYRNSPGRHKAPPMFVFRANSREYENIKDDVEEIEKKSSKINYPLDTV